MSPSGRAHRSRPSPSGRQPGLRHVYVDGGRLISDFLAAGYVDSLTLTVVPVLLGRGSRLFHEIEATTALRFVSATPYDTGLVLLRYERA